VDLALRLVMLIAILVFFEVIRVSVDDNASVSGLVLMHEDGTTAYNQAE